MNDVNNETAKVEEPVVESPQVQPPPQRLTDDQKNQALRFAHQYFSNFDRVPGHATAQWSQALDAIGLVINSLVAEKVEKEQK